MKIKIWCDNNANIHSRKEKIVTPIVLGYTDKEWKELDEGEKFDAVHQWAMEQLHSGFEEIEE